MTLIPPSRRPARARLKTPKLAILAGETGDGVMTEIGGKPILWHTMMLFGGLGVRDFVVAIGHRGEQVKRYMLDSGGLVCPGQDGDGWSIDLIDTGVNAPSGARIRRLRKHLSGGAFLLSTGEAVSDIDLGALLAFHHGHGRLATAVAVRPQARFGRLGLDGGRVSEFTEKPEYDQGWALGSLFVLEPAVFDYIDCDATSWEEEGLERLAHDGQLRAYRHPTFWQGIETLRDRHELEALWQAGNPPWRTWR